MPALKADLGQPEVQRGRANGSTLAPRLEVEINGEAHIPPEVVDLDSFCAWTCSDDYPEHGQFSYLGGLLWVDMTMEELYGHNQVRHEYGRVLGNLCRGAKSGRFIPDGMWMKNRDAALSTEPDGMYVSYDAFASGRVKRVKSPRGILFQLDGSPNMALEVVSETSQAKDKKRLLDLYWKAGIAEYWLVDVRGDRVRFDIFKHGPRGYTTTVRQAGGWLKSALFDKAFRLVKSKDPLGDPEYTLEVRD